MTIQRIRLFGDPVLRTAADVVTDFDMQLRGLVADLTETMLDAPGVGLAAPQIGARPEVTVVASPAAATAIRALRPARPRASEPATLGREHVREQGRP